MITYRELSDSWLVERDGAWLGLIEWWDDELRYIHEPDRRATHNSLSGADLFTIIDFMKEIRDEH